MQGHVWRGGYSIIPIVHDIRKWYTIELKTITTIGVDHILTMTIRGTHLSVVCNGARHAYDLSQFSGWCVKHIRYNETAYYNGYCIQFIIFRAFGRGFWFRLYDKFQLFWLGGQITDVYVKLGKSRHLCISIVYLYKCFKTNA